MIVTRALLALLLSAQQLYEEKLLDTMPLREKIWQQMNLHAGRRLLRHRTGERPPALKATGPLRLEKTGEHSIANYLRSYLPLTDGDGALRRWLRFNGGTNDKGLPIDKGRSAAK